MEQFRELIRKLPKAYQWWPGVDRVTPPAHLAGMSCRKPATAMSGSQIEPHIVDLSGCLGKRFLGAPRDPDTTRIQ
jgi:hypothetical protein